jgi:phosphoribosylamine---glycine ligase
MKKILLVGNGAREHCIGEALARSGRAELFVFGNKKNPGLAKLAADYHVGDYMDFNELFEYARKIGPDFAVVGPDDPIGAGATDALLELDIRSVSPLKTAARIESSKAFTRDLLKKYNIPGNPIFRVFFDDEGMREFIEIDLGGDYVVKADGLMGGKGVKVSGDHLDTVDDGLEFAREAIEKFGRVVIEEKFVGQEFSLMSFVDGTNVIDMPPMQDHKRAFVGDEGPNTGGMGSYSDVDHLLPFLKPADIEAAHDITVKTAEALFKETGAQFKGIMFGGFIAVKDGVRLIEYNARFGDPEVMNVLPLLKTDFVDVCEAILAGTLDKLKVEFEKKATVCKYIVPEGYPVDPKKGEKIYVTPVNNSASDNLKMYYASVDAMDDGIYLSSSRAIGFVGIGDSLEEAEHFAQDALNSVSGPVFYREDIGTDALIQERIDMMSQLRG